MAAKYFEIIVKREDHSVWIMINRPEKLNTITTRVASEILSALEECRFDREVRAVVLTGNGRNFSAGADIKQFYGISIEEAINFHRKLNDVVIKFRSFPKPIIALLHGYALGGGLEISESADIRVATETCIIGQPEIDIGINAGAGGNVILPRLIGHGMALYLALTGSKISASKALEIGLVDMVVPDDSAESFVKGLIEKISEKPYDTVSTIKTVMVNGVGTDVVSALEYEATAFGLLLASDETQDRIGKFVNKHRDNAKNFKSPAD
ncbi:3-hydroxypropionyl-coenzyme A dehydratase [Thermoplasmatales archaeon]|nr:3-hydroxypropionyl-coenzyme A dehydratase [Thermoplasmatales archaeon]